MMRETFLDFAAEGFIYGETKAQGYSEIDISVVAQLFNALSEAERPHALAAFVHGCIDGFTHAEWEVKEAKKIVSAGDFAESIDPFEGLGEDVDDIFDALPGICLVEGEGFFTKDELKNLLSKIDDFHYIPECVYERDCPGVGVCKLYDACKIFNNKMPDFDTLDKMVDAERKEREGGLS